MTRLRYEDPAHPHAIYLSPPEPGKEDEVVSERLAALRLNIPEQRKRALIARLGEYVRVPGRGPLRDEHAEKTPVGVTMTIDDEYGTMVGKDGDLRAQRAFGDRVRAEIAKILDCPLTCIEISGVYRGSIIVDFNIFPPEDSPRTARQLFSALSAMVPDPQSPLHTEVQSISRTIRVLLRGATHEIFDKSKQPSRPAEDEAGPQTPSAVDLASLKTMDTPHAPPEKRTAQKPEAGVKSTRTLTGGMTQMAKLVSLQQAAKDMQVGFVNKKIFYSIGKERKGPASWDEFAKLHADVSCCLLVLRGLLSRAPDDAPPPEQACP